MPKKFFICLCLALCFTATQLKADPLVTRDTRIKTYNDKFIAVVPFYKWYLTQNGLSKEDMKNLTYPIQTKYGMAKPFMKSKWDDDRVKLSIEYSEKPTHDVININGKEIVIQYVTQEEFINSSN